MPALYAAHKPEVLLLPTRLPERQWLITSDRSGKLCNGRETIIALRFAARLVARTDCSVAAKILYAEIDAEHIECLRLAGDLDE